jgi:soluble cytochrome b562|tara:strand:+ start:201 stop:908 length:708 start_codon:yes stop_codon:yes gene_type:complete
MAFKFKTKKRPTALESFAGGFAQGVFSGINQAAQLSLQDRLNQQKEFKDFRKDFSQSINYIDVSDEDRKILRDAQSMMLMGTLKNKNEVVAHLNAKSPNLGFKITGASIPEIKGSALSGYSAIQFREGKPVVTEITDPVTTIDQGVTPAEAREVKLATDKVKDISSRVKQLEDKKYNASITDFVEFTEDDQKALDNAKSILQTATSELDTIRTRVLTGTAVDTVEDVDPYSEYLR